MSSRSWISTSKSNTTWACAQDANRSLLMGWNFWNSLWHVYDSQLQFSKQCPDVISKTHSSPSTLPGYYATRGHTCTLSCQLPTNTERMTLWYLRMSHTLFFFKNVFLHPPSWVCPMTSGTPDKLWLDQNAERPLDSTKWVVTIPGTFAWFSGDNNGCNRNISLLVKVVKGQSVPPDSLGAFPTAL